MAPTDDAQESVGLMLQATVVAWWPEEKKETIKGDWCEPAKNPPTVKSVFSLEYKDGELVSSRTYLGWMRLDPFIES